MSTLPYQTTKVPVGKTQAAIFKLVRKFGATDFMFTDVNDPSKSGVLFAVRFGKDGPKVTVRLEAKTDGIISELRQKRGLSTDPKYAGEKTREQAQMMAWRVLHDEVKARLVAVRYGVIDFVRAFMADLLLDGANGKTLGDQVTERIASGQDPRRLLSAGVESE